MRCYKRIEGEYIVSIGTGNGGEQFTEQEYNAIMEIIRTPREEPPAGKAWALRADTLVYELVDVPEPPEPE